jgi:hypothetical protein
MRRLASALAGRRSFPIVAAIGARKPGVSDVEGEIAGLLDRSTPELRLA